MSREAPHDRLRVAHVTLGLTTGGQEKLLLEFVRCCDRGRFEPIIISLTDRGLLSDELESLGARVVELRSPSGLRPGLVLTLRRLFRDEKIDVVHTHDDRPLIYGALAGRWAGLRVIHTQHHGKLPNASRNQERLIRLTGKLPHAFVAVSQDAARHYAGVGRPILTIWNGVDVVRFAHQGPDPAGPIVVVARLSPEKNIPNLLLAARRLVDADANLRIEIAGDGPCRQSLVDQTRTLGLDHAVTFLGAVRDVPSLLARASLFVLPSFSEGISLTLLEAMARGLPIVATRVGGNPEVVVDGVTGRLVPSDDSASLAEAIASLRRDPSLAAAMGFAGRRRIEEHFDVRRMVAIYETLYQGPLTTPKS